MLFSFSLIFSQTISDSYSDAVGNCTNAASEVWRNFSKEVKQFQNLTFEHGLESYLLNVLSKVIDYRTVIKSIVHYEVVGDNPGIFKEILLFIWKTVLFENLYYEEAGEPEKDKEVKLNIEGDSQIVLINQIDAIL